MAIVAVKGVHNLRSRKIAFEKSSNGTPFQENVSVPRGAVHLPQSHVAKATSVQWEVEHQLESGTSVIEPAKPDAQLGELVC